MNLWKKSSDRLHTILDKKAETTKYVEEPKDKGRYKEFITPKDMLTAIADYFQWVDDNPYKEHDFIGKDGRSDYRQKLRPYTWQGLCLFLGVNTVYFNEFEARIKKGEIMGGQDFSKVITYAREVIYDNKLSGATSNLFSHHIVARDLGLADKKQLEGGDKPISILGGKGLTADELKESEQSDAS